MLALAAAGCFTGPINRPPKVTLTGPDVVVRGQPALYHADVDEPDQDHWSLTWALETKACAPEAEPTSWPTDRIASPLDSGSFAVTPTGPFCIWAFATDDHGAVGFDRRPGDPQNQAPIAKINVEQPELGSSYPLFTDFWLSSASSVDPDGDKSQLSFTWSATHLPPGSKVTIRPCPAAVNDDCFTADVAGEYDLSLLVTDSSGGQGTDSKMLIVDEDRFPCIAISRPDYQTPAVVADPTVDYHFYVDRVDDDVNPFPAGPHGRIQFKWYVAHNDEPFVPYDNNFYSLTVAANTFLIGDAGRVRVEVLDQNPKTKMFLAGCASDQCAATPGCFQRLTWSINFQ